MADAHPVIEEFQVTEIDDTWKANQEFLKDDFIKTDDGFFVALSSHTSSKEFISDSANWKKVDGFPHRIS